MDNLGQYFKDGIKKVSEAAMDAVVTSIVANQEQHIHHLQDIQQWGIIKLIQRWTTSKYLHQRPSVIPFQGFSLINLVYKKQLNDSPPDHIDKNGDASAKRSLYDQIFSTLFAKQLTLQAPLFSRSIGIITLNVKDCYFLLLHNPLNARLNVMKTFQWRILATYGDQQKETISARMVQKSHQEIISSLMVPSNSESLNFALHEQTYNTICWNHVIEFHNIKDLWSDICLSLMWRQTVENDKEDSRNNSFTSEEGFSSDACDPNFKSSKKIKEASGATYSSENSQTTSQLKKDTLTKDSLTLLEDTNPSKKRKAGTEWTLYGRVIIPLSSLLCDDHSFSSANTNVDINEHQECMNQSKLKKDDNNVSPYNEDLFKVELKDRHTVSSHSNGLCGWCCSSNLLLNLYPHTKKELKYYRPMPGYTALGMQNPQFTLGILSLNIQFQSNMSKRKALLLSMLNAPNSRWINSYSFEPQYLEAYGQRAKHCIRSFPRWVSKFLHLFSIGEKPKRNFFDTCLVAFFWIQILGGVLCLPFCFIPLCFLGILLCVSLSYRFGNHSTVPCSFSLIYKDNCLHKCDNFRKCPSTIQNMRHCCHENNCDSLLDRKKRSDNLEKKDRLKTYETKKEMLDGIVLCKSHDDFLNAEEIILNKCNESHNGLTERDHTQSHFEEHFHSHNAGMSENSTINDSCIKPNGERIDVDLADRTHSIKGNNSFQFHQENATSAKSSTEESCEQVHKKYDSRFPKNISVMESPIGTFVSSVCDSTSYCPRYPIFSDDVENQNVHHLLDEGLDLLDAVQRVAGVGSSIIEKLKFAFNWEDPLITQVSLVVAALVTLQITLVIYLFMKLPRCITRLPLLSPLFFFIILTDPFIQQKLWLETFGMDIVMIYSAFLSRSALQLDKKKTRQNVSPSQSQMKKKLQANKKDDRCQDNHLKDSNSLLNASENEFKVDCKISDLNTNGTGLKTWLGLRNRWRNVMNSSQKINLKAYSKEKCINQPNLIDVEHCEEKVCQKNYTSETRQWHETDICPVDNVSVLSVSANVVTLLQENHGGGHHTLKQFFSLKIIWSFLNLVLFQGPFRLVKKLWVIATIPLRSILFFLFLLGLHTTDVIFRFLFFWWLRLPDRREIEHRQIAASQRVSFFKNSMPLLSLKPSCTFKCIEAKSMLATDNEDINGDRAICNKSGCDPPGFSNVHENKNFVFKETNLCSPKTVSSLIKTNLIKMVAPNLTTTKSFVEKNLPEEDTVMVDNVIYDATHEKSIINKEFVSFNSTLEMLEDENHELIENLNETTHKSISQFLNKESPNLLSYRDDDRLSSTLSIIKKALPFCKGIQTSSKNVPLIHPTDQASNDLHAQHPKLDTHSITSSSSNNSLKLCSFSPIQVTHIDNKINDYVTESDSSVGIKALLSESFWSTPQHVEGEHLHVAEEKETSTNFKPAGVLSKILSNYNKNPTLALLKNYF
ncbi:uncharacterized protein LOC128882954 isoform X2 [Hylaeus volcanicus]|uniref:uncharacterized protein LOC128882954 isoform X2 n=1 Tax=Hylaeus volcanicus TaxID=313075 RepID=UPI0023B7CCFC|nr:uncharacterized protein LOC128882954 isoform X2 [Hylaeus volcanicus]